MRRLLVILLAVVACGAVLVGCRGDSVPEQYRADVRRAGKECREISARLIAAQIQQESKWDPMAVSSRGAQGIAQFMPQTWQAWGFDADGNGVADPFSPRDAIRSQGKLMCHLVELAKLSDIEGDPVALALAAYNAGWSRVQQYRGVPPYRETEDYVRRIQDRAARMSLSGDR